MWRRPPNLPGQMEEDLHILPRSVEYLENRGIRHELEERREIDAGRQGVDDGRILGSGDLYQAQDRPIGPVAHEFGVDCDVAGAVLAFGIGGEGGGVGDELH